MVGVFCNIPYCKEVPCQNGGTCLDYLRPPKCECAQGFEGNVCSIDINECDILKPCQNKGWCEDRTNDYICHCEGTGKYTQKKKNKNDKIDYEVISLFLRV